MRPVSQGKVIGARKGGGVFQLENTHPYRRSLAIGAGVKPGNRVKVQLDDSGVGAGLGFSRRLGFDRVVGTRRQQQRGSGCE